MSSQKRAPRDTRKLRSGTGDRVGSVRQSETSSENAPILHSFFCNNFYHQRECENILRPMLAQIHEWEG